MKLIIPVFSLFLLSLAAHFSSGNAFDPRDPNGNITVRWDVMSWTPDGYVAVVNITNYQTYRTVQAPGWKLGWTWARPEEVIWAVVGARATHQGGCSRFKGNIPHSCARTPVIVDMTAETPYNQQVYGCCKGGVLLSRVQDLEKSTAEFQISVGSAGTSNRTVRMPRNFTFAAPLGGYSCGPAKIVAPTRFVTPDGRRFTQALMTWKVVCTYSAFLASKVPACCVSLSSFDQRIRATCPTCACGCRNESYTCATGGKAMERHRVPPVKCTDHMCGIIINWHWMSKVKQNERRIQVSITNLNNQLNYSDWTVLVDDQALLNLTNVIHANHKHLSYSTSGEMQVVWGLKKYNEVITSSGSRGSTANWIMIFKGSESDWKAPNAIYFNGHKCTVPLHP